MKILYRWNNHHYIHPKLKTLFITTILITLLFVTISTSSTLTITKLSSHIIIDYIQPITGIEQIRYISLGSPQENDTSVIIDTEPPSKVTGVEIRDLKIGALRLTWDAAEDNTDIDHYIIYRWGEFYDTTTAHYYKDTRITIDEHYYYQVAAVDTFGNIGPKSERVRAIPVYQPPDIEEPEKPPEPNEPPHAIIDISVPFQAWVGEAIVFDGTASNDPDGRIYYWKWIFPNNKHVQRKITTHTFSAPGLYNITLIVTDNDGDTNSAFVNIIVNQPNNLPDAPHIDGNQNGSVHTSYLYSLYALDPDNDTVRYFIYWGDGTRFNSTMLSQKEVFITSHTWDEPGIYQIESYCRDANNAMSATTMIPVLIDVTYVGKLGYFIDTNNSGTYDTFHVNTTGLNTNLKQLTATAYLINTDADQEWEYRYDLAAHELVTQNVGVSLTSDYTLYLFFTLVLLAIIIIEISILIKWRSFTRKRISEPLYSPLETRIQFPLTKRLFESQTQQPIPQDVMSAAEETDTLMEHLEEDQQPDLDMLNSDIVSSTHLKISEIEEFVDNIKS